MFIDDLEQCYETGDKTGLELEEKLAKLVNNSLRTQSCYLPSCQDREDKQSILLKGRMLP